MMASVHVRHAAVDYLLELGNISRSGALVLLGSLPQPLWMTLGRKVELSLVALLDENEMAPSSYRDPLVLREEPAGPGSCWAPFHFRPGERPN